jgi:hypothetical protein
MENTALVMVDLAGTHCLLNLVFVKVDYMYLLVPLDALSVGTEKMVVHCTIMRLKLF